MTSALAEVQVFDGCGVKFTPSKPPYDRPLKAKGRICINNDLTLGYNFWIDYTVKEFHVDYDVSKPICSHQIAINGNGFGGCFSSSNHIQHARKEGFTDYLPKVSYYNDRETRVRLVLWTLTESLLVGLTMQRFGEIILKQCKHARKYRRKRL